MPSWPPECSSASSSTAYRNDYLSALNAATNLAGVTSLVSTLSYSRKWVAAVDWSDWDRCLADLTFSNAFEEAAIAEHTGKRLRMPQGVV